MFIGSAVGTIGNIGQTVYGASKAGLVGFTRSLAKEVASRGITANVVSPGTGIAKPVYSVVTLTLKTLFYRI